MPEDLIRKMKAGYEGSGLSEEEIGHRVYGHLNKRGLMHGNKETAKGRAFDKKHGKKKHDHGRELRDAIS